MKLNKAQKQNPYFSATQVGMDENLLKNISFKKRKREHNVFNNASRKTGSRYCQLKQS